MENGFNLYSQIMLLRDIPEFHFKKGDVGTIIEVSNDENGEKGYVVEFFDVDGNTASVSFIPESAVGNLPQNSIIQARDFVSA